MIYHKTRNSGRCELGKSGIAQLNTTHCFSEGFVVMHVDSTYVSRNVAKARISCCNLHWQPCMYLVACGLEVSTWFPLIRDTHGVKFLN